MKTDWEGVYRAAYDDVFRFLLARVRDEERARDFAQEAFARVLDQDPDDPRGLVFRVAANLATDRARLVVRRKRHLSLLRVEANVRAEHEEAPDRRVERREAADRLQRGMDELSDSDRTVLLLWNAGLSYAEIADRAGLAPRSVGTTLSRAKKKLIQALESTGDDDAALG